MKRKGSKCKLENSDGYIGDNESFDMGVSEPMASRKEDKSLYKCSHCFLIYSAVDRLMQHLLTHQKKQEKFPKTSGILETQESKTKEKNLPTCKVIITRYDNLHSPGQSVDTVHTLASNIQEVGAIAGKMLPRSDGLKPGKAKSLASRRSSLNQTSDCGITTEVKMKPHKCRLCTKSFGKRNALEMHIRTHTGERPHRCQLCSKSFVNLEHLKNHIRTHTGERPHLCQLCLKSFARQESLKIHIRTHTGERPHQCQLCSKSFGELENLKIHIRTHTGERPHRCQLCSKSFAQSGNLKLHIRTHTGERPHQCQLCSQSFARIGSLKSHIRTHINFYNISKQSTS